MSLSPAALASGGLLADYLCILEEKKAQMDNMQMFLNAHISFLKDLSKGPPPQPHTQIGLCIEHVICISCPGEEFHLSRCRFPFISHQADGQ